MRSSGGGTLSNPDDSAMMSPATILIQDLTPCQDKKCHQANIRVQVGSSALPMEFRSECQRRLLQGIYVTNCSATGLAVELLQSQPKDTETSMVWITGGNYSVSPRLPDLCQRY